jgi:hypothetical protein
MELAYDDGYQVDDERMLVPGFSVTNFVVAFSLEKY